MLEMDSKKRRRGRPRKNPKKLAQWTPPKDWVRVVAWVHPDERKALKMMALESDSSVAEIIRALASGYSKGVIAPEEIIQQIYRGKSVMEKIPTIFERDEKFKVVNKVKEGCEWVFNNEGKPTEKLDGTNIRITVRNGTVVRVEKRRNPTKVQKKLGIIDGWYIDADNNSPEDRWIFEAVNNTDVSEWPDNEHSCEALGPKIQGNPLNLEKHTCVPFNMDIPEFSDFPLDYNSMRQFLASMESKYCPGTIAEGIVFHHPDGRRAKIKRKDFAELN